MKTQEIICSIEEYSVVCRKLLRSLKMRSNGNPDELLKNIHDFYNLARVLDKHEVPERGFCLLKMMSQQELMDDNLISRIMPIVLQSADQVVTRIKCVALMADNALDPIEDFIFAYRKYEETNKKIPIKLAHRLSPIVMITEHIFPPYIYINLWVFKKCLYLSESNNNRSVSFSTILANNEEPLTLN